MKRTLHYHYHMKSWFW